MDKTYNLVELFSGIGSQAKALKNLGVDVRIQGTSEWDVHALAAYDVIHNSPEIPEHIQGMSKKELLEKLKDYTFSNSGKTPLEYSSLCTYSVDSLRRLYTSVTRNKNFVDVTRLDGKSLPDNVDIMTYSFPCQDLSNVGAFHGYNKGIDKDSGSRSSLLWQVGRILTEMKDAKKTLPRFLLLENVPTLLSNRHYDNFKTWLADLEKLGYVSHYYQLNASSFGLPQNRPRLLMISVYVGDNLPRWKLVHDYFEEKCDPDSIIADYKASKHFVQYTVHQLLRINYSNKKIFDEAVACTPNDTESRRRIWEENPQIILPDGTLNPAYDTIRTITTKQDRNPNSGNLYFDSGIEGRSKFRYLTPRECLLFMGFSDEDYRLLKANNVDYHKGDSLFARDKIIRMAGNSIPVKLLEGIFYQILQLDERLENELPVCQSTEVLDTESISAMIRSHVFKNGIRSRINQRDICPANATIVYPKHKTAIYLRKCPASSCLSCDLICPLSKHDYWTRRCKKPSAEESLLYEEALNLGWNVVLINPCELHEDNREKTLDWVVQCIRTGLLTEKPTMGT